MRPLASAAQVGESCTRLAAVDAGGVQVLIFRWQHLSSWPWVPLSVQCPKDPRRKFFRLPKATGKKKVAGPHVCPLVVILPCCFSSHCCFFGAACTSKPKASMSPPLDTAPAVQPQAAGVQAVENRAGPWPHTIPGPTSEGGNLCESCGVQGTGFRRKSQSSVSSFSLCGNLKACVHCLGIQGLPPCCLP